MQDLIERLTKATGPDRGLDSDILVAIGKEPPLEFGYQRGAESWQRHLWYSAHRDVVEPPHYTTSIDDARTLVPDGCYWIISEGKTRDSEPLGGAQVFRPSYVAAKPIGEAEHDKVEIALCIAALKARAALHPQERGGENG